MPYGLPPATILLLLFPLVPVTAGAVYLLSSLGVFLRDLGQEYWAVQNDRSERGWAGKAHAHRRAEGRLPPEKIVMI